MKYISAVFVFLLLLFACGIASAAQFEPAYDMGGYWHYAQTGETQMTMDGPQPVLVTMQCSPIAVRLDNHESYITDNLLTSPDVHEVCTADIYEMRCAFCFRTMPATKENGGYVTTYQLVDHRFARGALLRSASEGNPLNNDVLLCNDITHRMGFDVYESVCLDCGRVCEEKVPVFEEHTFTTSDGRPGGTMCLKCGYRRAFPEKTTGAQEMMRQLISQYESMGYEVTFDKHQFAAIGITKGGAKAKDGWGVSTVQYTSFMPIKSTIPNSKADTNGHATTSTVVKEVTYTSGSTVSHEENTKLAEVGWDVTETYTTRTAQTYQIAYVTMQLQNDEENRTKRVYFVERHDDAGWVYAFEADMYDEPVQKRVKSGGGGAFYLRSGAGQEYAPVAKVVKGETLLSKGVAYDKNGWRWEITEDDFTFCAGLAKSNVKEENDEEQEE